MCMAHHIAYFDESRMDDGKPFPTIGGYVSTVGNWLELNVRWRSELKNVGLTSFHAKDCWANKGQFADREKWPTTAKRELVDSLLNIILQFSLRCFVCTLDNGAYLEASQDRQPSRFGSQYELCGFGVSVLLGKWAEAHNVREVAVVFDQGNRYRHNFELGYQLTQCGSWTFARPLGSITFASDERVVPLQAADLYAWTMARTIDEGMAQQISPTIPWAYRVWHDVPRSENYIKRGTLEKMRDMNVFGEDLALNAKDVGRFIRAIRRANPERR